MREDKLFEKLRESFGGFYSRISSKELKSEDLNSILWDFKLALIENDVAMLVADHITEEIKKRLLGQRVNRFEDRKDLIRNTLKTVLLEILNSGGKTDLIALIEKKKSQKKPFVSVFVGINGTGKTTTIAKIANYLLEKKYSVVLAGSDTFRAGSIEQLGIHAKNLGIHLIKHQYGGDAAAVAFDAVDYANSRKINVVLIDTAGRMQTNKNLLMELEKIIRIVTPDHVIFVGDALAGNDVTAQAEEFSNAVRIDGSVLTKIDADAKGGAALSITYITKKPILFLGTGQLYQDLILFNPENMIHQILS
jgi:fused signal recognition particle receptor